MTKATMELGACQVGSGTDRPCPRPAVVKIRGIPFCEPCAREQEAYFVIGEVTEAPRHLHDESLVGMLDRMRRIKRGRSFRNASQKRGSAQRPRRGVSNHEPDAA